MINMPCTPDTYRNNQRTIRRHPKVQKGKQVHVGSRNPTPRTSQQHGSAHQCWTVQLLSAAAQWILNCNDRLLDWIIRKKMYRHTQKTNLYVFCVIVSRLKLPKSKIPKKEFVQVQKSTLDRYICLSLLPCYSHITLSSQNTGRASPEEKQALRNIICDLPAVASRSWRWYWDIGWQDQCCNGWSFYSRSLGWSEAAAYKCFPLGK